MTPSQTQALQEVREQIIKKHLKTEDQEKGINVFFAYNGAMEEYAKLYHTRLLAEAGKDVKFLRDEFYKENTRLESDGKIVEFKHMPHYVFQWFEEKVSTLLSAKQAELDRLSGWKREAMAVYGPLLDYGQNEMGLKPGESIVTKAIERLKEYSNLKSQLQESKAEVERLKSVVKEAHDFVDTFGTVFPGNSDETEAVRQRQLFESIKKVTKPQ